MSEPTYDQPDPTTAFADPGYDPRYDVVPDRRVKVGHLVTGLVFLGLAATWALRANGTLGDLEIAVVVPVVLVVAGVVGLLAAVLAGVRRSRGGAVRLDPLEPWDPTQPIRTRTQTTDQSNSNTDEKEQR